MSTPSIRNPQSPIRNRSVDLARGVAVVLMIATHATDAFLAAEFRSGVLWGYASILFGFVAPAFILLSGITLSIAVDRRIGRGRSFGDLFLRALAVLLIGYWLQIPSHSLRGVVNGSSEGFARLADFNVLQLIGVSMLIALAIASAARLVPRLPPLAARIILLVLAIAVITITPEIRATLSPGSVPFILRSWTTDEGTFPLLPYAAYFFIGFAAAPLLQYAGERRRGPLVVCGTGIAMVLAAFTLDFAVGDIPFYGFWDRSPQQVLFRLGGIIAFIGLLLLVERVRSRRSDEEQTVTWLERGGQASLGVYVLHLMLIYGSPVTMGMRAWWDGMLNRSLAPPEVIGIFIVVTCATVFVADAWRRFRRAQPRRAWLLIAGWWAGFVLLFLLA